MKLVGKAMGCVWDRLDRAPRAYSRNGRKCSRYVHFREGLRLWAASAQFPEVWPPPTTGYACRHGGSDQTERTMIGPNDKEPGLCADREVRNGIPLDESEDSALNERSKAGGYHCHLIRP